MHTHARTHARTRARTRITRSLVHFTTRLIDGKNVTSFRVVAKAWENLVGGDLLTAKIRDEFARDYTTQRQKKNAE
jgi:hypothetical protein